jgi:hypothetical protein
VVLVGLQVGFIQWLFRRDLVLKSFPLKFLSDDLFCTVSSGLLQTRSKKDPFTEPLIKKTKNMATAVAPAAAPAGAAPAPLASASLYVGDLDPGITEPQVMIHLCILSRY